MTNDIQSLLALPLTTLLTLVGGYIGYCIAYTGRNEHHGPLNIVFITLCFGLIARVAFETLTHSLFPEWAALIAALFSVIIASSAWRKWGSKWAMRALTWAKVSVHDGHKTAWQSVIADDTAQVSQIEVYLKSGVALMCDDTFACRDTKLGQMFLGEDGSVAFYTTKVKRPGEEWKTLTETLNQGDWGDEITYIPASEIERASLRVKRT